MIGAALCFAVLATGGFAQTAPGDQTAEPSAQQERAFSPVSDKSLPPPEKSPPSSEQSPPPPEQSPPPPEKPQPIAEVRTSRHEEPPPLSGPLGLGEADTLLQRAASLLSDRTTTTLESSDGLPSKEEAAQCVNRVEHYLARIAESLAYRSHYKWTPLGKSQPFSSDENRDHFPKAPRDPVQGAGAVRLTVTGGDIYLRTLVVLDKGGGAHAYPINRWARASLPKREVVFFREPADLVQADLLMENPGKTRVRVFVEAGVPDRPEYAREIALLCAETLNLLEREGPASATAFLAKARTRLREFRLEMSRPQSAD